MIFVTINSQEGDIARWEIGGDAPRLTHRATAGQPVDFQRDQVFDFRNKPPEQFRVESDERAPPRPPSGTPAVARAA